MLSGLLPLIPTNSNPNESFFALSTEPICWLGLIVCLFALLALGSCSLTFTLDEKIKNVTKIALSSLEFPNAAYDIS